MRKRKALIVLTLITAGAVTAKVVKRKRTKKLIRASDEDVCDFLDEEISKEYEIEDQEATERTAALERVLADVEEMYRDREEIVPEKVVEEVLVPESHKKSEKHILSKIVTTFIAVILITVSFKGYTDSVKDTKAVTTEVTETSTTIQKNATSDIELPVTVVNLNKEDEPEKEQFEELPELEAITEDIISEEDLNNEKEEMNGENQSSEYSDEDVYLLAQLIVNESGNQEREGQIGVAEVVVNRINSNRFPGTVEEVIYQPGQFSNSSAIKDREPDAEVLEISRKVLNEGLRVFNNTDVLYFRNPMITSGISPTEPVNWGGLVYFRAIGDHAFYIQENSSAASEQKIIIENDSTRMKIIETAADYGDRVENYEFGGKPNAPGDGNTNMDLDCSGYIAWVLGEALEKDDIKQDRMGSANINNAYELRKVDAQSLNIGDIGYRYPPGTVNPVNHCGIYLGEGKWIHCNSKDNGVVTEETDMFKYYYSAV